MSLMWMLLRGLPKGGRLPTRRGVEVLPGAGLGDADVLRLRLVRRSEEGMVFALGLRARALLRRFASTRTPLQGRLAQMARPAPAFTWTPRRLRTRSASMRPSPSTLRTAPPRRTGSDFSPLPACLGLRLGSLPNHRPFCLPRLLSLPPPLLSFPRLPSLPPLLPLPPLLAFLPPPRFSPPGLLPLPPLPLPPSPPPLFLPLPLLLLLPPPLALPPPPPSLSLLTLQRCIT